MFDRLVNGLRYRWQHREPRGSSAARKAGPEELAALKAQASELVERIGVPAASMTGAGITDYLFLHRYITTRKPDRVLELGGGVTTLVMAHAMHEIGHGELVTVEHIKKYADETRKLVVAPLDRRVRFVHTSIVGDRYNGDNVLRFDEIPGGHYDMMFCDFMDAIGGVHGHYFPHVDPLLHLDEQPTDIITDRKLFTLSKYAKWLTCDVTFDPVLNLGLATATRADIASETGSRRVQMRRQMMYRSTR